MRQARIYPNILSLVSGIFFLFYGSAACICGNPDVFYTPASSTHVPPMALTTTPTIPQSMQLSSTPGPTASTTATIIPTLAWPYNLIGLLGEHAFPSELFDLLSPDGQWLVRDLILLGEPPNIRIISSQDNTVTLYEELGSNVGVSRGPLLLSWSPDSSAVVVEGASEPAPCGYDSVIIYQITSQVDVIHNIYHLPDGEHGCFSVAWSPDGSQLALFDGADSVTILNPQGQVVQQMTIPIRWGLFWTARGLITEVRQEHGQPVHTELRLYDLATPDQFQTLLERDEYFLTMGFDEEFQRVLVASLPGQPTAEVQTYQLLIYDLKTGTSQAVAAIRGSIWFNRVSHLPPDKIVFSYDPRNGESKRLMIFDWATMQVTDYGEIAFLIGWRPNVEGVLVVQVDDKDNYWIDVIQIAP